MNKRPIDVDDIDETRTVSLIIHAPGAILQDDADGDYDVPPAREPIKQALPLQRSANDGLGMSLHDLEDAKDGGSETVLRRRFMRP
jgi:hypothetical protein